LAGKRAIRIAIHNRAVIDIMWNSMQIVQLVGAACILLAFGLTQTGRIRPEHYLSIYLNLVGGLLLATSAFAAAQWGFFLLNTAWFVVAAYGLGKRLILR
jgi:hypothetical protein